MHRKPPNVNFPIAVKRLPPAQKMPRLIRWTLRFIFLPFIIFDLICQKAIKLVIPTPFKQKGKCNKCGKCCQYILLPISKRKWLNKLYKWWATEINGFYPLNFDSIDEQGTCVVMGCRYLKKNNTCACYFFRPAVCRKWPRIEYFAKPCILKKCGFKPISRFSKPKGG